MAIAITSLHAQLDLLACFSVEQESGRLCAGIRHEEVALEIEDSIVVGIDEGEASGKFTDVAADRHDGILSCGVGDDLTAVEGWAFAVDGKHD